jgi:anhydro-N-acetylmuramic acid kinase
MLLETSLSRTVIGVMSGTSLDGIDVAVARIEGSGAALTLETLGFCSIPYSDDLRDLLLVNSTPASSSVRALSQLNVRLAHAYAEAIRLLMRNTGLSLDAVDAVGCHGQTVHHVPDAADCAGLPTRSTLQIGDPSTLAGLLGLPVVGDFRLADMALGGQGAPLAPYFDYVYFSDATEDRGLLNIGGIANLTVLPRAGGIDRVTAFDTGPGNLLIDALARRFIDRPFDANGRFAAQGTVRERLLASLLEDRYFETPPPKSTGREYFDADYVSRLLEAAERLGVSQPEDILATTTAFTAATIAGAYARFIAPKQTVDRFLVSGGGVHNAFLMEELTHRLAPALVSSTLTSGLDPDAKEALCFAVLAHETLNGVPSNVPGATGASRPAILGKICLPY